MVEWTNRLAHIEARFHDALCARFDVDEVGSRRLVEEFASYDPTRNKSATQWLIRTYIAGGFPLEDLYKAQETLEMFGKVRRVLPPESRDLYRYRTLSDLWKAIKPFAEKDVDPTGHEIRRRERAAAREESIILFEGDDGFTVAVPMTQRASQWWGRGTRWCTAAEQSHNAFSDYHRSGPLIVIVLPGGTKLQLHVQADGGGYEDPSVQFMDEDDDVVPHEVLEPWNRRLEPIFRWAIKLAPRAINIVPFTYRKENRDFCLDMVRAQPRIYRELPNEWQHDREFCTTAVAADGTMIKHLSHRFMYDAEIEATALRQSPLSIVGYRCKTLSKDDYIDAVRRVPFVFAHIPHAQLDEDICLEAMRSPNQQEFLLKFVPLNLMTREIALAAVSTNGQNLDAVPAPMRDTEMCLAAVKSDGRALDYVPSELRTAEICMAAVATAGEILCKVPPELKTPELCNAALENSHMALLYLPHDFLTKEVARQVLERNPYALWQILSITPDFIDREMCLEAVSKVGAVLTDVPTALIDAEIAMAAVKQNGFALEFTPEELMTRDLCLIAMRTCGSVLRSVPDEFVDLEMCVAACTQDLDAINYVPPNLIPELETRIRTHRWDIEVLHRLREGLAAAERARLAEVEDVASFGPDR